MLFTWYVFLSSEPKAKSTARSATPKQRVLRQKTRDTPSSSIARRATAGYRCRWHRRRRSYWRQSDETARREQCSKRKANMACKTALGRLDLSELLRRESEAAADSCKSQSARHVSEATLRAAVDTLRALDSLRRSSDRSSFPIAVLRAIFAFVCSSSIALVSLSDRSVANSFLYGDTTGRIGPRYGLCLLYTSPSPRDLSTSRMPSSA